MIATLSAKEVAALLGVAEQTIWRRCQRRRMVPPPVLSKPYRFNRSQVQAVIDGTYTTERQPRRYFGKSA